MLPTRATLQAQAGENKLGILRRVLYLVRRTEYSVESEQGGPVFQAGAPHIFWGPQGVLEQAKAAFMTYLCPMCCEPLRRNAPYNFHNCLGMHTPLWTNHAARRLQTALIVANQGLWNIPIVVLRRDYRPTRSHPVRLHRLREVFE